jgi:hypothetical protein
LIIVVGGTIKLALRHEATAQHVAFMAGLFFSILSDVALLVVVRLTVRRLSKESRLSGILIAILAQIAVIALLVILPFELAGPLITRFGQGPILQALFALAVFNAFTGLAASVFLLTLFFVLLHRALWPVLDKLVYPLAARQVIRNHTLMASIGTGCFVFAFPLMSSVAKGILEWLAK